MWEGKTDEDHEAWIEETLERWSRVREEVRERMASDRPEAEWAEYERQDLYNESVRSLLPEGAQFSDDLDETDNDVEERLYTRCSRAYRLGISAAKCVGDILAGGGR